MVERTVMIVNPSGIHARPAKMVVDFVKDYPGGVEVIKDGRSANLKSIIMVMTMGLKKDTEVMIRVCGQQEEAFLDSLCEFIQNLED